MGILSAGAALGKFAYDWISAGVTNVPIKAGEIYENANEFINSLDDDTKKKLVFVLKFTGGATLLVGGATVALPALGFCASGVKAASAAAYVHSMIGNVAANSTFAVLQSAGALGFAVKTKVALGLVGGYLFTTPWPLQPCSSGPGAAILPLLCKNGVHGNLPPGSNLAVLLSGGAFGLNKSSAILLASEIEARAPYPNIQPNLEAQREKQNKLCHCSKKT